MKKIVKLSELWQDVESALEGDKAAGIRFAVLEAQKILDHTLKSQGYPGKNLKRRLYWAGYSTISDDELQSALEKSEEIKKNFDYNFSDIEAQEIIKLYKKIVQEVVNKKRFGFSDKIKAFYQIYLNPKSVIFWRNIASILAFFAIIKALKYTKIGESVVSLFVSVADFIFSWLFVAITMALIAIAFGISYYFERRPKVKIKDE